MAAAAGAQYSSAEDSQVRRRQPCRDWRGVGRPKSPRGIATLASVDGRPSRIAAAESHHKAGAESREDKTEEVAAATAAYSSSAGGRAVVFCGRGRTWNATQRPSDCRCRIVWWMCAGSRKIAPIGEHAGQPIWLICPHGGRPSAVTADLFVSATSASLRAHPSFCGRCCSYECRRVVAVVSVRSGRRHKALMFSFNEEDVFGVCMGG